jgi:thioredoxin-related protein
MMKKKVLFLVLLASALVGRAQEANRKLYDPGASAEQDIRKAVAEAAVAGKHVMVQAGGNWCGWCIEFDRFCKATPRIDSLLKADYVICHLNYSKENPNKTVFEALGFPQRFGFPVFLILDGKGNRIHTQNSAYLEEGKSYDKEKVLEFLSSWNRGSLDPKNYLNYLP